MLPVTNKLATRKTFNLNASQAKELSELLGVDVDELVDEDDLLSAIRKARQKALHTSSPTSDLNLSRDDNPLIADAKKRRAAAARRTQ